MSLCPRLCIATHGALPCSVNTNTLRPKLGLERFIHYTLPLLWFFTEKCWKWIDRSCRNGRHQGVSRARRLGQLDWLATHARPSSRASFVWHYSNPRVHCLQRRIEDGGLVLLHCAQLMTDRQTECGVAQCNDRYLPTSCSRASGTPSHLSLGIIIYGSRD